MKKTTIMIESETEKNEYNLFSCKDCIECAERVNPENLIFLSDFSGKKSLRKAVEKWARETSDGCDPEEIAENVALALKSIEWTGRGIYFVWGYGFTDYRVVRADVCLVTEVEAYNASFYEKQDWEEDQKMLYEIQE